jgi:hypothetical protein
MRVLGRRTAVDDQSENYDREVALLTRGQVWLFGDAIVPNTGVLSPVASHGSKRVRKNDSQLKGWLLNLQKSVQPGNAGA